MIRAIMFDLDGTLVQSEKLRAQSYAIAVQRLRSLPEPDKRAVEAYRETVGAFQDVASRHIIDSLGLESDLQPLIGQYHASETWEVLEAMGKKVYEDMVSDPQVIRDNRWPHTIGLLRVARETYCKTALATNSYRKDALDVLQALDLQQSLDLVLTREDVQQPKPEPEIYLLAAEKLDVPPQECLVAHRSRSLVAQGVGWWSWLACLNGDGQSPRCGFPQKPLLDI